MQNLIANALKFRSTGRRPLVHVAAAREGEHWHLTVSDNGIGIGPEYLQQVFTIFQRLHGRSSYPGNGLGLAVVRKVAELHGGTAWAESVPGQGSRFHVTLRASP